MKPIEIDDELYRYLLSKVETFGETPSETIRRLIGGRVRNNGHLHLFRRPQKRVSPRAPPMAILEAKQRS